MNVVSNLKNHRTKAAPAPANRAKLLRIVTLSVNQIRLVKNLLRFFEVDTMFLQNLQVLSCIEPESHRLYNC